MKKGGGGRIWGVSEVLLNGSPKGFRVAVRAGAAAYSGSKMGQVKILLLGCKEWYEYGKSAWRHCHESLPENGAVSLSLGGTS